MSDLGAKILEKRVPGKNGIKGVQREHSALRNLKKMFESEGLIDHFTRLSGEKREETCRKCIKRPID
jgi:hypothetical protein